MAATDRADVHKALMAAALALPMAAPVQAESAPDRGSVSFKYLDYLDRQPGRDRVRVKAPSLALLAPIGSNWSVSGSLISDAISGASPAYHSSALGRFTDERNAGDVSVTRYLADGTVSLGLGYSTESDYVSRGLSLQGTLSSDDRNTTWSAGIAVNRDAINPTNRLVSGERKRVLDLLVGVTRVLGVHDVLQVNLSHTRARGYLSDPYKVFDQRPRERDATKLLLRWNHHLPDTGSTLRSSYRHYRDDYGIRAHTLGLEWVQPLPMGFTVTPHLRLHSQNAARFYVDVDPDAGPFVPQPPEGALFSTLDHRLSGFGARTFGVKLARQFGRDWTADIKIERYGQRGNWRIGGSGSPGLAPFDARFWQIGLSRSF